MLRPNYALGASLSVMVVCVLACSGQAEKSRGPETITLTANDNGKTVKIRSGESVVIRLAVQRGTGYAWQVPKTGQSVVTVVEEKDTSETPSRPGAPAMQSFRLSYQGAGLAELVFEYRRPWDDKSAAADRFRLHVDAEK